jgi:hypothetical protein
LFSYLLLMGHDPQQQFCSATVRMMVIGEVKLLDGLQVSTGEVMIRWNSRRAEAVSTSEFVASIRRCVGKIGETLDLPTPTRHRFQNESGEKGEQCGQHRTGRE